MICYSSWSYGLLVISSAGFLKAPSSSCMRGRGGRSQLGSVTRPEMDAGSILGTFALLSQKAGPASYIGSI